jgi:hypothetical protein
MFRRMMAHLGGRIAAIPREVSSTVVNRIIPQGAAELAQALNHGSVGYVPYGAPQSFDSRLNQYASRGSSPGLERGVGR